MSHDDLYDAALEAVRKLFSDTSVSQQETKVSLTALIDDIGIMIESLGDTEEK